MIVVKPPKNFSDEIAEQVAISIKSLVRKKHILSDKKVICRQIKWEHRGQRMVLRK